MSRLNVLYEDNHLLVVDKPAGIATMGAEAGLPTVHAMACDYLRVKYKKPGKVFVGVVSRLDSMTTGALVLARTSKAASRLTPQFADKVGQGAVKIYLAVVEGDFRSEAGSPDEGVLVDHVRKDDAAKRMRVVVGGPDALEASLQFLVLGRTENATVIAVQLISGRKHQIRVQFADRGHPVLGDNKYGSRRQFDGAFVRGQPKGVALHSWRLQIVHPTLRDPMEFVADIPSSWSEWAPIIGKPSSAWKRVARAFEIPPMIKPGGSS
ncbi:Ribosomal large subunit pseudouridine synthase C [Rubripirellula lacrimiformis]|uniref:Ribosomal large subunit pseudouridine synthase C n=1 Tax=Rubripirellula lacrimiformis TaxID=1930273 RepID=A0A517NFE0_9BACT|nr:RluA family pseudouridine synthase [Rubripirellula lacrimiformis]QDT05837.1 Ribosomal large subunit pseudouridine synthase C [Rubripirellula lacrimiformis]